MYTENDGRKTIVTVCRLLDRRNLITGPGGNVSVRLRGDSVLITPSGYLLAEMREEEIVRASTDGACDGRGNAPSSELGVHLGLYARFPEAGAVIHAHPPTVLGLAAGDVDFNTGITADVAYYGNRVAVVDSPPTGDLPDAIFEAGTPIIVVRKHGTVIAGSCLSEAFHLTELLERYAWTLFVARARPIEHTIPAEWIDRYCDERPATIYRDDRLPDMLA